jgi:hypothetical protein
MASIILGAGILAGHAIHHRKQKKLEKLEKERLAGPPEYSEVHGNPTVVVEKQGKQQKRRQQQQQQQRQQAVATDLPSYDSVVAGRHELSALQSRDEKPRRSSEYSQRTE